MRPAHLRRLTHQIQVVSALDWAYARLEAGGIMLGTALFDGPFLDVCDGRVRTCAVAGGLELWMRRTGA